jgi:hypothetical protein
MSSRHSQATGAVIHVMHRWSPANQAAREALSVQSTDVGKVARQVSDGSFWILTNHSPATWSKTSGVEVAQAAAAAASTAASAAQDSADAAQGDADAAQASADDALALSLSQSDHVTGTFTTTSTSYTPLLRANGGDPVAVTVTSPPAGTKATVTLSGTMNNGVVQDGGPSDQVFMRPTVNGVSYDDGFLGGCYCQGGQRIAVTGEWVIPLTETSVIGIELRTLSGNLVACYPDHPDGQYLRTSVKMTVRLGS